MPRSVCPAEELTRPSRAIAGRAAERLPVALGEQLGGRPVLVGALRGPIAHRQACEPRDRAEPNTG